MRYNFYFLSLLLTFIASSCQEGLAPVGKVNLNSYINGIIRYVGGKAKFPDSSQVFGIYAAAFKKFPSDSGGIINEILKGNVYLKLESLPYPADSSEFSLEIPYADAPVNIEYIVIAMQTGSSIQSQKAIGVFTESGDNTKPSQIFVEKGRTYNINIKVDFDSLPPQPFK